MRVNTKMKRLLVSRRCQGYASGVNQEPLQMESCEPAAALNVLLCPVVVPKNRVGGSAAFSFVFAFQYIGETFDTPAENGGCGHDFASGVHKYLYAEDDPVNRIDISGSDSYLYFDTDGGAWFAQSAGHIGIRVHYDGGIIRRDAAWGSLGPLATFGDYQSSIRGANVVVEFPDKALSNGQSSGTVIANALENNRTSLLVSYCPTYSAEVMKAGGYELGNGYLPTMLMHAAIDTPGVDVHRYPLYRLNANTTPLDIYMPGVIDDVDDIDSY
jgi:hypothetical protein